MADSSLPSDLSFSEWAIIEPILSCVPMHCPGIGRPRVWNHREILDAIFYIVRSGCAWRMLPHAFPPWQTVYAQFRKWRRDGTWERIHAALRERCRKQLGRDPIPSGAVMDSQSVRTTDRGGLRGFDGFKKISGRKRHILTDTNGLLLKAKVHAANLHDAVGAKLLLPGISRWYERLARIWADQGYRGADLQEFVEQEAHAQLTIVRRSTKDEVWERATEEARTRLREGATVIEAWSSVSMERSLAKRYEHLPKRWVIERTFSWLGRNRRMSKDYEFLPETSETMIYIVMIRLMLKRLVGNKSTELNRKRPKRTSVKNSPT